MTRGLGVVHSGSRRESAWPAPWRSATADSSTAMPFRNDKGLGVVIPTGGRNLLSLPRASLPAHPNLPPGPPKLDYVPRSGRFSSRAAISLVPFRVQSRLRRCEGFGNTPDDGRGNGV